MKDSLSEPDFLDGLQNKTLYIKNPEANQTKLDAAIMVTVNQRLVATSVHGFIVNKSRASKKLHNLKTRVAKFVQNANAQ